MGIIHQHQWKELSRHSTEGLANRLREFKGVNDAELFERMLWGVTVIVLRCEGCGDLRSVEVKGRSEKAV